MKDSFYSSFENKYRGSRSTIKTRLQVYIPLAHIILNKFPKPTALDLGCGRGEWLELVRELGYTEDGVDLDDGMLEYCHQLSLRVEKRDALAKLASLPDNSVAIISSFHLVEHIGFDNVNKLVKEALRVLSPGGILIMETPNPENITVASNNYYLDPTHNNPIPRQLLSFLTEHAGFARTKILRLQEDPALFEKESITLHDVINGVSPDYSVVAQKQCDDVNFYNEFNVFFENSYGISLDFIVDKFEKRLVHMNESILSLNKVNEKFQEFNEISLELKSIKNLVAMLEEKNKILEVDNDSIHKSVVEVKNENKKIRKEIYKVAMQDPKLNELLNEKFNEKVGDLSTNKMVLDKLFSCQQELKAASEMIIAMRSSTSWKITLPVRFIGKLLKGEGSSPLPLFIKSAVKKPVLLAFNTVNKNPKRKAKLIKFCRKIKLDKFLKPIYLRFLNNSDLEIVSPQVIDHGNLLNARLSPHGKDILNKLIR